MSQADATDLILPLVLKYVKVEKTDEEDVPWLNLLLATLPLLSADDLRSQILKLALTKGEVNETVPARVKCSKLLGGLASQLVRHFTCEPLIDSLKLPSRPSRTQLGAVSSSAGCFWSCGICCSGLCIAWPSLRDIVAKDLLQAL